MMKVCCMDKSKIPVLLHVWDDDCGIFQMDVPFALNIKNVLVRKNASFLYLTTSSDSGYEFIKDNVLMDWFNSHSLYLDLSKLPLDYGEVFK